MNTRFSSTPGGTGRERRFAESTHPGSKRPAPAGSNGDGTGGFTLLEVVVSLVIVAVVFGAIINGYLSSSLRGQWTAYSLAAQSLGQQAIEQTRSAVWDGGSGLNQLTNIVLINPVFNATNMTYTGYTTNILDVPWKGTNYILATNFVTIKMLYINNDSNTLVQVQMVRVDTVWPFNAWSGYKMNYYTNTLCTLQAPDNRDPSTLGATPPPGY
jgi:prepilin-type N-terminal cleavage/methylation domain-containing protein